MELIFITEARFLRGADGKVYSADAFTNRLWERYLTRFERITVVARVLEGSGATCRKNMCAQSERVSFLPLPYYLGATGFLKNKRSIEAVMQQAFGPGKAYILRVPGIVGRTASQVLRRKSIPYGVEVVGDPWDVFAPGVVNHPLRPLLRRLFTRALKQTVQKSSAALYVTQQALQRRYPVASGVFQTAASNVQIDDTSLAPQPKTLASGGRIELISAGSLAQLYKAPDVMLKALAELTGKNFDCRLTWLGDGKYKAAMQKLAAELQLADRVDFRGSVPPAEVGRALAEADIFVSASRTEGLPRVVVEAMACGLPCVATRVGGVPELLDESVLVEAGDAAGLAARLAEMMRNPLWAARQAAINLKKAQEYKESVLMRNRQLFYDRLIRIAEK